MSRLVNATFINGYDGWSFRDPHHIDFDL
jgi:cold shock CspA family protein